MSQLFNPGPPAPSGPPAHPEPPARPEPAIQTDLHRAKAALIEAELSPHPSDRFLAAHLAALRVAAIVLSVRARPGCNSRPRNAWLVLAEVAPELAEWATFFAATEGKREAVRSGATTIVNAREADDLIRDAQTFLDLVECGLCRHKLPAGAVQFSSRGQEVPFQRAAALLPPSSRSPR
jgi:hypothetical protein